MLFLVLITTTTTTTTMEKAFEQTVIAFKLMQYCYTLKIFFKDEFKSGESAYLIPFSHILYVKRTIFPFIRDSCDYVCPYAKECDGHQFLNFVEKLWEFMRYAVEDEKCFFKYIYFYNFRLKSDAEYSMKPDTIAGWDFKPFEAKNLSHLSYSRRMSY